MKSLRKTRRIQIISVAFVALALSTGIIGYALRDGINYFRSPTQVVSEPPVQTDLFRIGGMVQPQSIVRGEGTQVSFVVTDCSSAVPVTFEGILPDLTLTARFKPLKSLPNTMRPMCPLRSKTCMSSRISASL